MSHSAPLPEGVNTPPRQHFDPIVSSVACPACKAAKGVACRTMIDGADTGWTHDARMYAHLGARGAV